MFHHQPRLGRDIELPTQQSSRRDFLRSSYNGLGMLALAGMLADELDLAPAAAQAAATAISDAHHKAKAKHCIFLFMAGGVSQMDTFDPKPELDRLAGGRLPQVAGVSGALAGKLDFPHVVLPSPFKFHQYGESGRWVAELFPGIGSCVDEMAFIHGIMVDNENHGPATSHATTGHVLSGSPSIGSWVTYGLGSPSADLPSYVVIHDPRGLPMNSGAAWGNGYLPANFQGTVLRPTGTPILNLERPPGVSRQQQRRELDLLQWLNARHGEGRPIDSELEARIEAYELAYRMQQAAPELVELDDETDATQQMYGLNNPQTAHFGRQCLLARRMVERGVRYTMLVHGVQITHHSWDDHGDSEGRMRKHAAEVDQPVAALLNDLKQRGLLEETLVVWASEMGRTPFVPGRDLSEKPGRDHNQYGLVMWMAGGDVKAGATVGATDPFGIRAAEQPIPIRDVHATLLHLLGLDDSRLRYLHAGRYRQLTDIGGRVLTEIVNA